MTELSAVVAVGRCRERAQRVVDMLCRQTAIARMEIVVADLCPEEVPALRIPAGVQSRYLRRPDLQVWGRARAAAVAEAAGPIVAFIEDHCYPAPDWAAVLIEAHRQPWAVVGYALTNANPASYMSRGGLVNNYGLWMHPATAGATELMPGGNVSYKRSVLVRHIDRLAAMMTPDFNLQQQLLRDGERMCIEPRAMAAHENFKRLLPQLCACHAYGRLLAGRRAGFQGWSWPRRIAQGALTPPLAPFICLARLFRSLRTRRSLVPAALAALPVYLASHGWAAVGEALGYLIGEGTAERDLSRWELDVERDH